MVASFHDLKTMITKVCTAKSAAKDYAEKHCFCINMHTLNNMFIQKGLPYRVLAGTEKLESYVPYISDIHMISDYVDSHEDLTEILDGYTQIAVFSLFSIQDKNGEITIEDDDEHKLSNKDVFLSCNNHKKLDIDFMTMAIKQLPIYRILVVRKFKFQSDSFVYDVYFRSNKQMSALFKKEMNKKDKEANQAAEAESDNVDLSESEETAEQ